MRLIFPIFGDLNIVNSVGLFKANRVIGYNLWRFIYKLFLLIVFENCSRYIRYKTTIPEDSFIADLFVAGCKVLAFWEKMIRATSDSCLIIP